MVDPGLGVARGRVQRERAGGAGAEVQGLGAATQCWAPVPVTSVGATTATVGARVSIFASAVAARRRRRVSDLVGDRVAVAVAVPARDGRVGAAGERDRRPGRRTSRTCRRTASPRARSTTPLDASTPEPASVPLSRVSSTDSSCTTGRRRARPTGRSVRRVRGDREGRRSRRAGAVGDGDGLRAARRVARRPGVVVRVRARGVGRAVGCRRRPGTRRCRCRTGRRRVVASTVNVPAFEPCGL